MKNIQEIVLDIEKNPIENGGHIYHPIPFEEFQHLKTSLNKAEFLKKSEIVLTYIHKKFKNKLNESIILDIGANGGFFTFSLAKEVKEVVAFETNIRYTEICQSIIEEKGIDNITWNHSAFDVSKIENYSNFSVTLMLSVFQWMAEGGKNLDAALRDLYKISQISDSLVFELGFNNGKSALKTDKEDHYQALIDLLKENTVYTNFELIGVSEFWHQNVRYMVACTK